MDGLKPKSKLKTQLNRQIRQIKFPPSLAKIRKRVWTLAGGEHLHEMRHFGFFFLTKTNRKLQGKMQLSESENVL